MVHVFVLGTVKTGICSIAAPQGPRLDTVLGVVGVIPLGAYISIVLRPCFDTNVGSLGAVTEKRYCEAQAFDFLPLLFIFVHQSLCRAFRSSATIVGWRALACISCKRLSTCWGGAPGRRYVPMASTLPC